MSNLNANEEDQQSLAAFRKSYPIGFSLHDNNGEHCLYITDDANGQKLHLELSNTSQQNIDLAELNSGEATSENHHVELRFRPGTLRLDSLDQISLVNPDWKLSYKKQTDRTVSLYFLRTDTSAEETLEPSEKINLTLLKVRAAADGGARVTQVELKYQKLSYENDTTGFISGSRVQRLSVVNHLGQQNIPLHVGFVGSNTILNDGNSESKLILWITNVFKKDRIPLNPPSSGNNASKFIIYFDIQSESESKDWALGTKSEVDHISIEGKDWKSNGTEEADWKVVKEPESGLPRWVLTHQNETEPGLAPGQVVQLTIKKIKSSLPSGHTNLYVRYENIPGYWDGEFVCTIEKTPLLYRDTYDGKDYQVGQSKVGIGTTNSSYPLEIKTAYGSNGLVHTAGQGNKQIKLATYVRENEGGYIKTISAHSLHFAVNNSDKPSMTVDTKDNVGIGTPNPEEKLHVKGGNLRIDGGEIKSDETITLSPGNKNQASIRFLNKSSEEVMKIYEDKFYNIVSIGEGKNKPKKNTELHVNNSIKLVSGDPNSEEFHSLQISYNGGYWEFRTEYQIIFPGRAKEKGNCLIKLKEATGEWQKPDCDNNREPL